MIGSEMVKRTDKFLFIAAKFYWEQTLVAFEKSLSYTHNEVVDGIKDFLEDLEKPINLEISAIGEPELIKIIRDFYAHGCPKTDNISINLKNLYFDPKFDYIPNWLQENNVKTTSNWNEFSHDAQGTIVIAGGWHNFLKTKEFSERICDLISRKMPVVLLQKVERLDNDEGIRNLSDIVQVSLFKDRQLVLTNGDTLTVKPFEQKKSVTQYPFERMIQAIEFEMIV